MSMNVEVVELLQQEVRRVVVDAAARMVVHALEEHLEGDAVEQVLARMQLEADAAAGLVEGVEDRPPALGELVEGGLDQARRALRPGVQVGPGQRAGKADVRLQPEVLRRLGRPQHLLHRPVLALLRIAAHRLGREGVEGLVVGRVHRDELALQVRAELGDLDAVARARRRRARRNRSCDAAAFSRSISRPSQRRQLHALEAEAGGPAGDRVPGIERRLVAARTAPGRCRDP